MAIQMLNINNFDIDRMSSKFAQRYYFFCILYCKKNFILGSLNGAENANCLLFYCPPHIKCMICTLSFYICNKVYLLLIMNLISFLKFAIVGFNCT